VSVTVDPKWSGFYGRVLTQRPPKVKNPRCKRCGHPLSWHVVRRLIDIPKGHGHYYNRCDGCSNSQDYWQVHARFHEFYPIQPVPSESVLEDLNDPTVKRIIARLEGQR
jgi:hypothetical protein